MGAVRRIAILVALLLGPALAAAQSAQPALPLLTAPVNDFANVIDEASASRIDQVSRALQQASGDVVVVATVQSIEPWADIREMAVKLFENGGKGIGQQDKDNGLLVLVAIKERKIWIEVGYGLEEFITDGFAGETTRDVIAPSFRQGNYGAGIVAGVSRLAGRIAERRGVTLAGVPAEQPVPRRARRGLPSALVIIAILIVSALMGRSQGPGASMRRRGGRWGGSTWSGWNSGVGPFGGGGFGGGFGGFGGGGGGGGFGGFGGGGSGGGGGGGSW